MSVPAKSDPRWRTLLEGAQDPQLSTLATKLMVQRLRQAVKRDPTSLSASIAEIHDFFTTNAFAHRDLAVL
jgi:hypothetical protein